MYARGKREGAERAKRVGREARVVRRVGIRILTLERGWAGGLSGRGCQVDFELGGFGEILVWQGR